MDKFSLTLLIKSAFLEILVEMKCLFSAMFILTSIPANAGLGEFWRDDRSGISGIGTLILLFVLILILFSKSK